jgi:hypothetical protein
MKKEPESRRVRSILRSRPFMALIAAAMAVGVWFMRPPPSDPRVRSEQIHGIHLPLSASKIQCRGGAWYWAPDRGEATLFEMKAAELANFVAGLSIKSRNSPERIGPADPTVNGWNVWPDTAKSFVPGNRQYGGFSQTWSGDAIPVEMLSCESPRGDWLHVEYWKLPGDLLLVKMFTDWN